MSPTHTVTTRQGHTCRETYSTHGRGGSTRYRRNRETFSHPPTPDTRQGLDTPLPRLPRSTRSPPTLTEPERGRTNGPQEPGHRTSPRPFLTSLMVSHLTPIPRTPVTGPTLDNRNLGKGQTLIPHTPTHTPGRRVPSVSPSRRRRNGRPSS